MGKLQGKSAIVTGASRGIGKAIAELFAREGARVVCTARTLREGEHPLEGSLETTVSEIKKSGGEASAVACDISSEEDCERLAATARELYGPCDVLVNNAGITRDDLIMRMSLDAWREVLETNLFGAFYTIKAVTRPMLKARSGRIVNMTSVSGQAGQTGQANYSSAKAGLIGLTKATARELASRGITCNAVAPGFVMTELTKDLPQALLDELVKRTPLGRFGTAEEVASLICWLASDECTFSTGATYDISGGRAVF